MSTEIREWQCDVCLRGHKKKLQADQCEKSHKSNGTYSLSDIRCGGCGSTDCNGECQISDMDFNN